MDSNQPFITFQICLVHPIDQIQQRFESLSTFSIPIKRLLQTLRFCSINIHSTSIISNMTSGRIYHASTYISQDNSVLITGGFNPSTITALATTNKFKVNKDSSSMIPSKNMSMARYDHTEDVVPSSGLVLISGGMNSEFMPHNTAELFNSISGMTSTVAMSTERATHKSAVISQSNKIVLIGGQNSSYLPINTGDVYDGTRFRLVPNTMMHGRVGHTITYLPTINKVLITGGSNGNTDELVFFDTVELYDVASNRFQPLSNIRMSSRRAGHTATYIPVPLNKVLIVGGGSNETNVLDTFDLFDVSTLSFVKSGPMKKKRTFHTATLLKNNKTILLAGGRTSVIDDQLAPCELFDSVSITSTVFNCLNEPRFFHTATFIPTTGGVFMCGGIDSNKQVLANCEHVEL